MNTLVHLDSYCPDPSKRVPCNRLPMRVHLELCRELEGADELWIKLTLGFQLNGRRRKIREVAPLGSDTIRRIRSSSSGSTATALLDHLWKAEGLTVGDLLDAFDCLGIDGSVTDLLCDYVDSKLAGVDAAQCILDDPRDQVRLSYNSICRVYIVVMRV